MFELFKDDEYKIGINKIASLAVLAQDHFYKAYQLGTQFFMKSSNINNSIKAEILSFSYVESLYHDVIANSKFAKYYENEMDTNKDNIAMLIAYQRKALRLLELGLSNENVVHLLDQRPDQKKDLQRIRPELKASLERNINRNKEIYKKPGTCSFIEKSLKKRYLLNLSPPKSTSSSRMSPKKLELNTKAKMLFLFHG